MIHDLSVQLTAQTPVYPGDPPLQIHRDTTVTDGGYLGHTLSIGTHNGTHIDAPAHMVEGAPTLDQISLDTFIGHGKLMKGFSLAALRAANLQPDDIVLFHTGMSDDFYDKTYFTDYPVMDLEIADYLIESGVKLIGMDTCSADNQDGFPIHKRLLGAGIPIIETMTNLASLTGKQFTVYALPLKFDLDGSPARVIAITPDD